MSENGSDLEGSEVPDVAEKLQMRDPVDSLPRRSRSGLGSGLGCVVQLKYFGEQKLRTKIK